MIFKLNQKEELALGVLINALPLTPEDFAKIVAPAGFSADDVQNILQYLHFRFPSPGSTCNAPPSSNSASTNETARDVDMNETLEGRHGQVIDHDQFFMDNFDEDDYDYDFGEDNDHKHEEEDEGKKEFDDRLNNNDGEVEVSNDLPKHHPEETDNHSAMSKHIEESHDLHKHHD